MRARSLAIGLGLLVLATSPAFGATVFEVESNHTTIGFSVPIMGGFTKVTGKFSDFDATIHYDAEKIENSSVSVTLRTASIDTGIDARDRHLRTADFFDAEKYPEITFKSRRIEKRGEGLVAVGTFSMHGVRREIEIPCTVEAVRTPVDEDLILTVKARFEIDREEYGVGTGFRHDYEKTAAETGLAVPKFIGKTVTVEVDLWTWPEGISGEPGEGDQEEP